MRPPTLRPPSPRSTARASTRFGSTVRAWAPRARFSFMGDASGPLAEVVDHRAGEGEPLLDRLQRRLDALHHAELPDLPFEFDCGFVGYLGYELKSECGYASPHRSEHPDAALIFSDRLIAFDHEQEQTYLLCLHRPEEESDAEGWLDAMSARLSAIAAGGEPVVGPTLQVGPTIGSPPSTLSLARSREQYLEDVEASLAHLLAGDSYEICLTNQISAEIDVDPLDLYRALRRANPAPFASYLRFGDLAVLSSSPERFLRVSREGEAEARPIKGTSRRGATPAEDERLAAGLAADEKNRAENLMIVDLLRNDLGARLRGRQRRGAGDDGRRELRDRPPAGLLRARAGCGPAPRRPTRVRACFPPGSMTGAPKLRTTEILDGLEGAARGVYSGAIGWLRARRRRRPLGRDPHHRPRPAGGPRSGPAARSSSTPIPGGSTRRCC